MKRDPTKICCASDTRANLQKRPIHVERHLEKRPIQIKIKPSNVKRDPTKICCASDTRANLQMRPIHVKRDLQKRPTPMKRNLSLREETYQTI